MSRFDCDLITTRHQLDDLQPEWNELLQRSSSNNVFLTWEWTSSWWDCLSGDRQPWVVSVRQPDTGRLLGLLPLAQQQHVTRRGLRYRVLTFMGSHGAAPDHLDLIVDKKHEHAVAPVLLDQLTSQRNRYVLKLSGMAPDSTIANLLQARSSYSQLSEEVCPYLTLPSEWESYHMTLGKQFRKNLRSRSKRLERDYSGTVTYQQVVDGRELESVLSTLFRFNTDKRESLGDIGAFSDRRFQEFHQQVAAKFLNNGWLRLYRLSIDGRDIALDYNFHYNNVFSGYSTGYNREFQTYGPGTLLLAYVIKQAIQEGASEYDFLRGAEPYKFQWTEQTRNDLDVEFSPGFVPKVHRFYLKNIGRVREISGRLRARSSTPVS